MKNISFFLSEKFQFLEVNFSIHLNRHVFVMAKLLLLVWAFAVSICHESMAFHMALHKYNNTATQFELVLNFMVGLRGVLE